MAIRFQGLHSVTVHQEVLPPGVHSLNLVNEVRRKFGGTGLQQVLGQDVFVGFHKSESDQPYQESVFVATKEGFAPVDELVEAKLQQVLEETGVSEESFPYLQKYDRQDYRGVFGHSPEFDMFHQSGRKVGVMVDKERLALFRPNGELAYFPRQMDKNMLYVVDGPRGTNGDFYVMWKPYIEGVRKFLLRQLGGPGDFDSV